MSTKSVKNNQLSKFKFVFLSLFLLLFAIGLLIFQLSKAPKEVKAVVGTLNVISSGGTMSGNLNFSNYGTGIVGTYTSTRYQGVFAMGDAYKLATDGTTTGTLYGLAWSHPNAGGVAANLNTHGLLVMEGGTFLAAVSGSIRARDDMRAPIFYDSNNTGYYVDPNGSSRMNTLYYVDQAYIVDVRPQYMYDWNDSAYYIDMNNTSRFNYLGRNYGFNWTEYDWNNTAYYVDPNNTSIYNDLRANIFYDYGDTGYYVDPNGTSNLNQITGATKARWGLPDNWTNRPSITGDVNYWTGSQGWGTTTFNVLPTYGSTFFDTWGTTGAMNDPGVTSHYQGLQAFHYWNDTTGYGTQIAFCSPCQDGTMHVRQIWGGGWSSWYKILTNGNISSYADTTADTIADNGVISVGETDFTNQALYTSSNPTFGTVYAALSGNATSASNASACSVDGSCEMYTMQPVGVGGDSGRGAESYAIFQEGGAWVHPYPDLRIAYHTGIKLGAHYSYNGIRFYNNSDMVTETMSVGNGDNNVRVAYDLYVGSAGRWMSNTAAASHTHDYATHRGEGTNFIDYSYGLYDAYRGGWRTSNDLYVAYAYSAGNATTATTATNVSGGTISIGGNITINNTSPTIYFQDSDNRSAMIHNNSNLLYILRGCAVNSTSWCTYNGVWPFYINLENNTSNFGGAITATSDIRLKTNIEPLPENILEKVKQLRGVYFNWKTETDMGNSRQIGIIAQEVEKIFPELVGTGADGYKTFAYDRLGPILIEAVKEQQKEIDALKSEVSNLKKEVDTIKQILKTNEK